MIKGLYTYYNGLAKESREVMVSNNDDEAKLKFVNDMNQQKENWKRQKIIFPMEKLLLVKLGSFNTEEPSIFGVESEVDEGEVKILMTAAECPSFDEDAEETEAK